MADNKKRVKMIEYNTSIPLKKEYFEKMENGEKTIEIRRRRMGIRCDKPLPFTRADALESLSKAKPPRVLAPTSTLGTLVDGGNNLQLEGRKLLSCPYCRVTEDFYVNKTVYNQYEYRCKSCGGSFISRAVPDKFLRDYPPEDEEDG